MNIQKSQNYGISSSAKPEIGVPPSDPFSGINSAGLSVVEAVHVVVNGILFWGGLLVAGIVLFFLLEAAPHCLPMSFRMMI